MKYNAKKVWKTLNKKIPVVFYVAPFNKIQIIEVSRIEERQFGWSGGELVYPPSIGVLYLGEL